MSKKSNNVQDYYNHLSEEKLSAIESDQDEKVTFTDTSNESIDPIDEHNAFASLNGQQAEAETDSGLRRRRAQKNSESSDQSSKKKTYRERCTPCGKKKSVDEERERELKYGAMHIIQLFVPVSLCMILVVTCMNTIYANQPSETTVTMWLSPYDETTGQTTTGNKVGDAIINTLIVIAVVIVVSFVLLLLFFCKCITLLKVWFSLATALIMYLFFLCFSLDLFRALNISVDWVSGSMLAFNYGSVGLASVFWKGPIKLQQAYLILNCSLMGTLFIRILPGWTAWFLLGAIVLWDLFAVLAPCGPLRLLIDRAQEEEEQLTPGLVYSSLAGVMMMSAVLETDKPSKKEKKKKEKLEQHDGTVEEEIIRLGLGDFIFYSLLVGKASMANDWNTTLACFIAILVGLCLTLVLLSVTGRALPALPISVAAGLMFYFVTNLVVSPMCQMFAYHQMMM